MASSARTSWRGVATGLAVSSLAAFQQFKLPPVLPDYLADYPVAPWIAALFMSVYALVGVAVSGPLGRWLDQAGVGRALRPAAALFALGCLVGLWRPDSWVFFLGGRALEGIGFAICAIAGPIIAARSARPEDLPLVTGLVAGWVPLGQILGGALTALWPDWRFLWAIGLALALGLGMLGPALAGGKEAPYPLTHALIGPRRGAKDWLAAGIFMLWSIQFMAFATWLPSFAALRFGLDLRQGTGAYLLPVLFILIFNILTGWALRRGVPLLAMLAAALALQALVWAMGPFLAGPWAVLSLILYGIGAGIAPACLFHLPHYIAGGRGDARGFGTLMIGRNLGSFAGPILLPFLVEFRAERSYGLAWFALITLAGLVLIRGLAQGTSR